MLEGPRASPGHGADHMQRYSGSLSEVHVCEAGRVGYDGVSNKEGAANPAAFNARVSKALQHFGHHGSLGPHVTIAQAPPARGQAWIRNHICHKASRVPVDWVTLKSRVLDERRQDFMGGQAHFVSVPGESCANGDERLHVSTAVDDLNDNI